jgi:hypothetical protein
MGGSLLSTTSYMQRHETTPDDEAEALGYYSGYVRADEQYGGQRRADSSKFISDNFVASNRARMLTYRPRTIGISLQRLF